MATAPAKPVPAHLRDDACYVCGNGPHPSRALTEGGHVYWSNADAAREFAADAARLNPRRPEDTPEARYVATHRPY